MRVCACAREARRHELLRLALALLLLLGLRLLRLLLLLGWGVGLLRRFGAGIDALHFEEVCAILFAKRCVVVGGSGTTGWDLRSSRSGLRASRGFDSIGVVGLSSRQSGFAWGMADYHGGGL